MKREARNPAKWAEWGTKARGWVKYVPGGANFCGCEQIIRYKHTSPFDRVRDHLRLHPDKLTGSKAMNEMANLLRLIYGFGRAVGEGLGQTRKLPLLQLVMKAVLASALRFLTVRSPRYYSTARKP